MAARSVRVHIAEADAGRIAARSDVEIGAGASIERRVRQHLRVRAVELVAPKAERDQVVAAGNKR